MGDFIDLKGKKFTRLTVIERAKDYIQPNGKKVVMWECVCDCPKKTVRVVAGTHLRSGHTVSCGCIGKERRTESNTIHGKSKTWIYRAWRHIKDRCYNPKNKKYHIYGGAGKGMCERWLNDFQAFYDDVSKLPHFGEKGYSIDRIDGSRGYSLDNVRWADDVTQNNNIRKNHRITYNGQTLTISQWAKKLGIKRGTLDARLRRGWPIEKALKTP